VNNCFVVVALFHYFFAAWELPSLTLCNHKRSLTQFSTCHWARGVTRLNGARGKKQVWPHHIRNWGLSEANVLHRRKYLWHCLNFLAPPQCFGLPMVKGRRQRKGGAVVPGPPIWNRCPPISRLAHRLLHTSNTVFKKCGSPCWFLAPPSGFWPPLLLNPGDGPAMVTRRPRNCTPLVTRLRWSVRNWSVFHKFISYAWWQPRKERQQWK